MTSLSLKPTHKAVKAYYDALAQFEKLGVKHEGRRPLRLPDSSRTLCPAGGPHAGSRVPTQTKGREADRARRRHRGLSQPGLALWALGGQGYRRRPGKGDQEPSSRPAIRATTSSSKSRAAPFSTRTARNSSTPTSTKPDQLVHVLDLFFGWRPPAFDVWEKAVEEFKGRVQELGENLARLIRNERQTNAKYRAAFADFLALCRASLNPNLSENAVEEMVIQHLLTERIFRKVFDIGDFMQRNVIAQQIEKVIEALTSRAFSRDAFVKNLEHFYVAIEQAAETIGDFSEKQRFLNTVYERSSKASASRLPTRTASCTPRNRLRTSWSPAWNTCFRPSSRLRLRTRTYISSTPSPARAISS